MNKRTVLVVLSLALSGAALAQLPNVVFTSPVAASSNPTPSTVNGAGRWNRIMASIGMAVLDSGAVYSPTSNTVTTVPR